LTALTIVGRLSEKRSKERRGDGAVRDGAVSKAIRSAERSNPAIPRQPVTIHLPLKPEFGH
jgi:hypothetical protein